MIKRAIININLLVLFFSSLFFFFVVKEDLIYPIRYDNYIINYASKYNLSPSLISSVIFAESNYNEKAVSKQNAIGLMQIKKETAIYILNLNNREFDDEDMLYNPEKNIEIGCMYLQYLSKKFYGLKEILCSYNAGEGNVKKWLSNVEYSKDGTSLDIIPFLETKLYVDKIFKANKYYLKIYKI